MKDFEAIWMEILEYAKWAPSPHNTQLWKVKISGMTLEVFYDPERLLPVENESGSFMTCGMGIFVEAICIAASPMGYAIEVMYPETRLVQGHDPHYFCTLTFVQQKVEESLSRELLLSRRTSRLPYTQKNIETEIKNSLTTEANRFGHTLTFSEDKKLIHDVLILNKNTLFYDMEDAATRKEVDHWIRYSKNQALTMKDGLWTYCLHIPSMFTYLFFRLRTFFNISFVKKLIGAFYLNTTKGTTTIGWFSGPMDTPQEWFISGRMLMRVWLLMTQQGIYLHPFGSIITNPRSHKEILGLIKQDESAKQTLWLILRLGYSDVPPRSYRLDTKDLLIK